MIDKKTIKKSLGELLEKANFLRKGQSWYLEGSEAIIVLNLQKSDWGDRYFMNIGIWLKALGEAKFPKENLCHLNYRAESLFPEERELIFKGLSLERSDTDMLNELSKFTEKRLIPFLKDCAKESKLKEFLKQGVLERGLIRIEAREYLES